MAEQTLGIMSSVGGGFGNGGIWGMRPFDSQNGDTVRRRNSPNSSGSSEASGQAGGWFPVKQAATAATLALTGDTIAQLRERWVKSKTLYNQQPSDSHEIVAFGKLHELCCALICPFGCTIVIIGTNTFRSLRANTELLAVVSFGTMHGDDSCQGERSVVGGGVDNSERALVRREEIENDEKKNRGDREETLGSGLALSERRYWKDETWTLLDHNWLRALRMTSYGFLLYGPGSYVWYQYLDRCMPKQTAQNVLIKVVLNQIVLGPSVIAVVFAWNNLWQGKLSELPNKYKKDALRTLLFGFRFWIPVSVVNFWAIPLQARVGFMSMNSIFWNFYLSSTLNNHIDMQHSIDTGYDMSNNSRHYVTNGDRPHPSTLNERVDVDPSW
ncbi:Mpv17/PMP22 [Cynara cardunculus var. scolymus]|uniref:Mpv17/PMP22 n=1 Tax=Cynara cardunculus var. scolymus TaxID=59895 RepID=A0A124SDE5_CYNCS|nr:Mpv17/PMP22 [Cynara cardunculus var. scolymus]